MDPIGITHLSSELAPYRVGGGLGIGLRRLLTQLAGVGIRSRVLMQARESGIEPERLLWGEMVPLRVMGSSCDRLASFTEQALELIFSERDRDHIFVAHDSECAALLLHLRRRLHRARLVYWLHSLSDRMPKGFPPRLYEGLGPGSLSAAAIVAADLVVTSSGVLADANEFEWPMPMQALQRELQRAQRVEKILCVEPAQNVEEIHPLPPLRREAVRSEGVGLRPFVMFPARSKLNKGLGFIITIAERLAHLDADFVVTDEPDPIDLALARPGVARIRWIGWQPQTELFTLAREAHGVLIPSLSEGFGLGAAELVQLGAQVLYHDVGGLRSLPASSTVSSLNLSSVERARLYQCWADFIGCERDEQWSHWDRAQPGLAALIDRWVEHVEVMLDRAAPAKCPRETNGANWNDPNWSGAKGNNPSWGVALAERICRPSVWPRWT